MGQTKFEAKLEQLGLLEHVTEVCRESAITMSDLFGSQSPPAPAARARVYRWLRDEKHYGLKRIGSLFSRSHSTIIYALRTLEKSNG